MDLIGLKDKLIVVGGGAGGIGSTVCDILRCKGAEIIVADKKNGIDLSNPITTQNFFNEKIRFPGRKLDGYVSLVYGGGGEFGILNSQPYDLEKEINDTLLAAVYPIREAVMLMKESGGGHIVVISSINSVLGLDEFAYDIAKGALNRIAPDIATSCGKFGIYATTLCLGTVAGTPSWEGKEKAFKKIADSIPDKRVTTAEEVGQVVAFLLSDYANVFNGATLIADRGWHLKPIFKK